MAVLNALMLPVVPSVTSVILKIMNWSLTSPVEKYAKLGTTVI